MIVILSLLVSMLNAQSVSPYGAKVIGQAEGGRPFLKGYDAVMINPAGTYYTDSGQFGLGAGFGNYKSFSVAYVGESGFHIMQAIHDLDSHRSVAAMQTYFGFAYELAKWWVLGANTGYNYLKSSKNGWDVNFGIDFGPGLPSANHSGIVGAVTVRNPFEKGGTGEVGVSLGYSYRSAFNMTVDNIYSYNNDVIINNLIIYEDYYDLVFVVEAFPLESDDFSMSFSGRINDVSGSNDITIGTQFGYIGESFKFDVGLYANDFSAGHLRNVTFGFSMIYGM